jgi:Uma2 family endonuclease
MAAPVYYSAEMVRTFPDDGNRYETVHGELLVTPAPTLWHQEIVRRLLSVLGDYLEAHPVGHVLQSPADISWSDDTLVQPDLFVADLEETRTLEWANINTLLLVIEVLSPSTARYDRFTKRRLYQEVKVPTYWIVDLANDFVEVWEPEIEFPRVERERVVWAPHEAAEPLGIELPELFRPI